MSQFFFFGDITLLLYIIMICEWINAQLFLSIKKSIIIMNMIGWNINVVSNWLGMVTNYCISIQPLWIYFFLDICELTNRFSNRITIWKQWHKTDLLWQYVLVGIFCFGSWSLKPFDVENKSIEPKILLYLQFRHQWCVIHSVLDRNSMIASVLSPLPPLNWWCYGHAINKLRIIYKSCLSFVACHWL